MIADRKLLLCCIILLAWIVGGVAAGSLTPPGAPGPTGKILPEVEPRIAISPANTPGDATSVYRIASPGSYYLTLNMVGASGMNGIMIASDDVVLDLNGFNLSGWAGSLSGITVSGQRKSIVIRNGTVGGWGWHGVDLGDPGEYTTAGIVVEDIIAHDNGGSGIRVPTGVLIQGCVANLNGSNGIHTGRACVIRSCTAWGNKLYGVQTLHGCIICDSACRENLLGGISAGIFTQIEGCLVYGGPGTGTGITIESGMVTDCIVQESGLHGIRSLYTSTIMNNVLLENKGNGILVNSLSKVAGNNCRHNGFHDDLMSGIHASGSHNRIEGNNCTLNVYGVRVTGTGNMIMRNTCSGNVSLNYSIVAGNRYGPIINITAGGAAAASGNSAPSTLASTDPWANFAY